MCLCQAQDLHCYTRAPTTCNKHQPLVGSGKIGDLFLDFADSEARVDKNNKPVLLNKKNHYSVRSLGVCIMCERDMILSLRARAAPPIHHLQVLDTDGLAFGMLGVFVGMLERFCHVILDGFLQGLHCLLLVVDGDTHL